MRLWSFQPSDCVTPLVKGQRWVSHEMRHNRIKPVDAQYVRNADSRADRENPVYCFSKVMGSSCLDLRLFFTAFGYLSSYYNFNFGSGYRVMLELEVPECEFLNMKTVEVRLSNSPDIVHSGYGAFMEKTRGDVEVLLPFIEASWVVAIRYFKDVRDCVSCVTVYCHDFLFPAWTVEFLVTSDSLLCAKRDGKYRKLAGKDASNWLQEHVLPEGPGQLNIPDEYSLPMLCSTLCFNVGWYSVRSETTYGVSLEMLLGSLACARIRYNSGVAEFVVRRSPFGILIGRIPTVRATEDVVTFDVS